ncbi:MAG: peptidoglycan editing factor PgeF [Anaerolineales bacterium]
MQALASGDIRYYQFDSFDNTDVMHGVFARHGGVSTGPYASLNLSVSTGDSLDNVRANRERAFRALGRAPASVADLWQVHSAEVVRADSPRGAGEHLGKADALVTNRPGVTLFLRFADCVPVLLVDPCRQVIGLAHAGWKGTLAKIVAATVQAMVEHYGSRPADIWAGIGPSIGPCHYEVGPEVVEQTWAGFGAHADELLAPRDSRYHLDLWAANARVLREAGIERIESSHLCTACRTDEFFSHRGERGRTGRFGALIGLR